MSVWLLSFGSKVHGVYCQALFSSADLSSNPNMCSSFAIFRNGVTRGSYLYGLVHYVNSWHCPRFMFISLACFSLITTSCWGAMKFKNPNSGTFARLNVHTYSLSPHMGQSLHYSYSPHDIAASANGWRMHYGGVALHFMLASCSLLKRQGNREHGRSRWSILLLWMVSWFVRCSTASIVSAVARI